MCFFCIKFSVYAVMLWAPMFFHEVFHFNNTQIANFQSLYEIGTITGAIILGLCSDYFDGKRSPIILTAVFVSLIVSLTITFGYTGLSLNLLRVLMFVFGFCLGTAHHLICITCTADLGRQQAKEATATITGIIDGMGTLGSGLGQIIIGVMV